MQLKNRGFSRRRVQQEKKIVDAQQGQGMQEAGVKRMLQSLEVNATGDLGKGHGRSGAGHTGRVPAGAKTGSAADVLTMSFRLGSRSSSHGLDEVWSIREKKIIILLNAGGHMAVGRVLIYKN